MGSIDWQNIRVRLGDLKPWSDNPRCSTKAQAERILKSFDEFGQVETIAVSPALDVYNGHQRLSALVTLHGADYEVDARQCSRLLTDEERKRLTVYLHAGAVGSWDWDTISSWDAPELIAWGMDDPVLKDWKRDVTALDALLKSEQADPVDAEPQIDRAAELNEKWQVVTGDLWQIGEHRLLCGDSTRREDVERVMAGEKAQACISDPPYNVAYSSLGSNKDNWGKIENDEMSEGDFNKWLVSVGEMIDLSLASGASIYLCHGDTDRKSIPFIDLFQKFNWKRSATIIWAKQAASMGWQDYRSQHECVSYGWKQGAEHYFTADRSQTTLWQIDRDAQAGYSHPTQKPVELFQRAIENSTIQDSVVFDPFIGSGTTMVACQNLNRKCRAIEISPNYCAVILERMSTAFPELEISRVTGN